jgi:metal-responsive CopG/Arc/MetJ family transcriptional regulator
MRITVNLAEDVVKHLDTSAEAHHESRAEFAGMLIESTLTSQNKILTQYAEELTQRDTIIKRQTDEIQGLRRLLDEARGEAQKKSAILEGESGAVLAAKNLRIEELSASVARLEGEVARAPAAGDVARLENDVADLRARVQERDVQIARLADLERELSRAGERERELLDLIYQEKGEKKALLERLPPAEVPKKGIWERLLGGGRGE